MSRLTAAQVVNLGEYLEPDFDPASLTVAQLLGVLGYHNIAYPQPYTKAKLVQVFNNEVKSRATKFKKERIKKENSIASEEGITDGITGQPLAKPKATPARRSSRRLSQIPKDEDESPTRPDPPKRRRSSAQPALGGTSSRRAAAPPITVIEESEPEEEEDLPVKKVGRTKKTSSAGVQSRRVSHVLSGAEDSGWEDNNIFQSGAEDSSPARPTPVRPRPSRGTGTQRKTRKSTSAPPQMHDSSPLRPANLPDNIARSPPQSPFRPSLPPIPKFEFSPPIKSPTTAIREFSPVVHPKVESSKSHLQEIPEVQSQEDEKAASTAGDPAKSVEVVELEKDGTGQTDDAVSQLSSEDMIVTEMPAAPEISRPLAGAVRLSFWAVIAALMFSVYNYKAESSSIGFCDRGTNTSRVLDSILSARIAKEECQKRAFLLQNSTEPLQEVEQFVEDCGLPPLVPKPRPTTCTPCPDHASCDHFGVTCDSGYLLKPNILLSFVPVSPSRTTLTTTHLPQLSEGFFTAVSAVVDGLPLFGSIGLPPRCVEDPQRKKHIGALGKSIESRLTKERGQRICRGDISKAPPSEDLEEAIRWGIEESQLREFYRAAIDPTLLPQFDDVFNTAIQQLTQWGGVFVGETSDGKRYIAHKTPEMSLQCLVKVKSREVWAAWRPTVLGSILSLLLLSAARLRIAAKHKENKRVAGLVQVALDTLRNQEMAHYTDPLTTPAPYLSSIQLRDLVLQDEHSVPTRRRLWEKVERVVEGNANVRANLEEIEGGDETRVWRWVGSSGRTPGRKELRATIEEVEE
ncbi:hypothetical protein D9613_003028 [Agrocybe pediades]|uniref:Uncharacterized protein n=1 Tax=Agrocybe pediades TaxID=84607 RepID=A0A8H4QQT1_9AGAR|nr:hypothetical protein D9613_003028 [Agrocybe pediades]